MMEKLINARQCMADDCDDENEENSFAEEVDEVEKVDEKIATYTDEIITKNLKQFYTEKEEILRLCLRMFLYLLSLRMGKALCFQNIMRLMC